GGRNRVAVKGTIDRACIYIRFPFFVNSIVDRPLRETKTLLISTTMKTFQPTERTTLKRLPKRAVYDRDLVYQILDEGFICHVGFAVDCRPFVIPTGYARVGD